MDHEPMPDLLTAVKILASSTVEIAAASVGETSLVKAVRQMEENGKGLDSTLETAEPEVLEAVAKEAAVEAVVEVSEEVLKSAEAVAADEVAGEEVAEAPSAEETSSPAAAEEEQEAAPPPEEDAASAPTVEEVGEVEVEDQAAVPGDASKEAVFSTEASPEDTAEEVTPAEEATPTAEAAPVNETAPDETTPVAETSMEEGVDEVLAEDADEAMSTVVDTSQLAAASTGTDLEVLSSAEPESSEKKPCHSCQSAPSAGEEVAPPAVLGLELGSERAVDVTHEARELVSLVEEQNTEAIVVVTAQS